MDIQCIIDKFKSYGYQLYLQDGLLRYKYIGNDKPSEEVLRMVEELRTCKNEVVACLKQQENFEGQTPSARPIKEGDVDTSGYKVTADDIKLNEYATAKYNMNPNGHKCISCGKIAHRFCLGLGKDKKFWWGYQCLECSPYNEPERN